MGLVVCGDVTPCSPSENISPCALQVRTLLPTPPDGDFTSCFSGGNVTPALHVKTILMDMALLTGTSLPALQARTSLPALQT